MGQFISTQSAIGTQARLRTRTLYDWNAQVIFPYRIMERVNFMEGNMRTIKTCFFTTDNSVKTWFIASWGTSKPDSPMTINNVVFSVAYSVKWAHGLNSLSDSTNNAFVKNFAGIPQTYSVETCIQKGPREFHMPERLFKI